MKSGSSINGVWTPPSRYRCDSKASYPNLRIAGEKAAKASLKTGDVILAYQCYDCGRFHIGHAENAQIIAHAQELGKLHPVCVRCGKELTPERRKAAVNVRYCSARCKKNIENRKRKARLAAARNQSTPVASEVRSEGESSQVSEVPKIP